MREMQLLTQTRINSDKGNLFRAQVYLPSPIYLHTSIILHCHDEIIKNKTHFQMSNKYNLSTLQ